MNSSVAIIIPTKDMANYLSELWATINTSRLIDRVAEVIFVDDGSKDNTAAVIESFKKSSAGQKIKFIKNSSVKGRYRTRLAGVEAATAEKLLFLDTRISLPDNFGVEFEKIQNLNCAMCMVDIDETKGLFNLYWKRTHEWIFKKHFQDVKKGFFINSQNFETYAKGTGGFYCTKNRFLEACNKFGDQGLLSDDTYLLSEIVKTDPIWVQQDFRIIWEPRQDLNSFLERLWERGPGFAEYHVFTHRGLYFRLIVFVAVVLLVWIAGLLLIPSAASLMPPAGIVLLCLSVFLFSKSLSEAVRMLPLHLLVAFVAGLSIVRGIVVVSLRKK